MGGYPGHAAEFLVRIVFGLFIFAVMMRFLLQWVRADFYNPLSQAIVTITQPALKPLRRVVPSIAGLDLASVVLMLALAFVEMWLVFAIRGQAAAVPGLAVLAVGELLYVLVQVFFWAIIILVVISWVNPGARNHITSLIHNITDPLLGPARRAVPPLGGLDLSPIVVIIGLKLAEILLIAPIQDLGTRLALY